MINSHRTSKFSQILRDVNCTELTSTLGARALGPASRAIALACVGADAKLVLSFRFEPANHRFRLVAVIEIGHDEVSGGAAADHALVVDLIAADDPILLVT